MSGNIGGIFLGFGLNYCVTSYIVWTCGYCQQVGGRKPYNHLFCDKTNQMEKREIISEIRRIAKESGGKAPGFQRFATLTGLRKSDWYPNLWLRWGDAIIEADCQPNEYIVSYDANVLITKYIDLIRELNHFPIEGELRIKNKADKSFPSHTAFSQLGSKQDRVLKILKYCQEREELHDIVDHCTKALNPTALKSDAIHSESDRVGFVYLLRHGTRNEYKIGRTNNRIRREGEIRL